MALPAPRGLYDPRFEHDACGLGVIATLGGAPSHRHIEQGLEILRHLSHRGAAGRDPETGDGAGILIQIPHALFASSCGLLDGLNPESYGVAMCFLARQPDRRRRMQAVLENAVAVHGQRVLGWREVPVDLAALGRDARATVPSVWQLFIGRRGDPETFERTLFMIRKRAGRVASQDLGGDDFYVASCSSRTVVYKGLVLPEQLDRFYADLRDARTQTRLAIVHSRFSTNTFPTWQRAHPFRRIAHNGEINTLSGNVSWMRSREPLLRSPHFESIEDFCPIVRPGGSDSAALDNVVDFLVASGRSIAHVMMMLMPTAFSGRDDMSDELRAFYEYHGCLVEPWDGPAAVAFTDGVTIGAMLDRNGLRPARYAVTSDGLVVLASEAGVLSLEPSTIVEEGRVGPGQLWAVDTAAGKLIRDPALREEVARRQPYRRWLSAHKISLDELPACEAYPAVDGEALVEMHTRFGYTQEDLELLLGPMARTGEEPIGSMGTDVPLAVLSSKPQLLYRYFKQRFAQVTNPPIDPIREEIVMSLVSCVGAEGNLLEETPAQCGLLHLPHPILSSDEVANILRYQSPGLVPRKLSIGFSALPGEDRTLGEHLHERLAELQRDASRAVADGVSILVLSDRTLADGQFPLPALLAVSTVHQHLLHTGQRARVGIIVDSAEPREVAHIALLIGYGASAVCPYGALDTVAAMANVHASFPKADVARANLVKAFKKGLLKTMSKMGISAVSSYQGAQVFEAVGIRQSVVDAHFGATPSRLGGIGLGEIASEVVARRQMKRGEVAIGGLYQAWPDRTGGERHLWDAVTVASLQKAVRLTDGASYERFRERIVDTVRDPVTLRTLWEFRSASSPIDVSSVEATQAIVRRFATGAMSLGSLSREAHETLAVAMNRIGGRSNTGEGGEDPEREVRQENGDSRRSAIRQIASGRFGVTTAYLVGGDEIQIKMAQGAKPGEGGQLPGHKVDAYIATIRHATAGVTLISPPPHHDIYSIEDLSQLIYDLRAVNPHARISVKLVSEVGVGTVAAGVAKAGADAIVISGHDGGTGASPLSSIQHAGTPWELGLAEADQVLKMNGLRDTVVLQVDGQLRTGRDVVIAAMLGADEFGFATAPLVAMGCVMTRKCHLNTCPVGIATQDPVLRERFAGKPEDVTRYLFFVADEVRGLLAELGVNKLSDIVGRRDLLAARITAHPKARLLDFSSIFEMPPLESPKPYQRELPAHPDLALWDALPALVRGERVERTLSIVNSDRAFGAKLSGELVRQLRGHVLPDDQVQLHLQGSAGQSFGAFLVNGISISLHGRANDYVAKGLSGGVVAVRSPNTPASELAAAGGDLVIVGNAALYGATSGRVFIRGSAGERFAVRNSGASAVVEGVGDHGCEYMTKGTVVVLGRTGRNFAAGMSGGLAYVYDEDDHFADRCNRDLVSLDPLGHDDWAHVVALLEEHHARTGSPRARARLSAADERARWVKVYPHDLRRVSETHETPRGRVQPAGVSPPTTTAQGHP